VKPTLQDLYKSSHLSGGNASFVEAMYEDWLADESSVPSQWADLFTSLRGDAAMETGRLDVQEKFRQLGHLPSAIDTQVADRKEAGLSSSRTRKCAAESARLAARTAGGGS
jgi:2-oxoglutarate dehydrogenase E1 component